MQKSYLLSEIFFNEANTAHETLSPDCHRGGGQEMQNKTRTYTVCVEIFQKKSRKITIFGNRISQKKPAKSRFLETEIPQNPIF